MTLPGLLPLESGWLPVTDRRHPLRPPDIAELVRFMAQLEAWRIALAEGRDPRPYVNMTLSVRTSQGYVNVPLNHDAMIALEQALVESRALARANAK